MGSNTTTTSETQAHVMLHFLPRDRASPSARASADVQAGLAVEAAPGTSRLGCTRKATSVRRCTALWGDLSRPKPVRHKLTSCYTPLPRQSEPRRACQRLSPVRSPCIVHEATTTSAARRVRVASVRAHLVPRDSERSGALACAPRESRLCVRGRSWLVAPRSCADGERPLVGAVVLYST